MCTVMIRVMIHVQRPETKNSFDETLPSRTLPPRHFSRTTLPRRKRPELRLGNEKPSRRLDRTQISLVFNLIDYPSSTRQFVSFHNLHITNERRLSNALD
ncbi:hypothetical protein K0M31_006932 [Melipona bicolor]|uniref:Uncharacterized protein n=1 Tax=Melipona bicolor TaxID=60889 RepID=A0AA40FS48_9HYME|nr:hypothetical protein K0M31_006932 [Melipona bicolor]